MGSENRITIYTKNGNTVNVPLAIATNMIGNGFFKKDPTAQSKKVKKESEENNG